jgi:hypothetical protein
MEKDELREAIRAATRRYNRTKKAHEDARDELTAAIVTGLLGGVRPTEAEEDSPFKGARIRQIAREHKVPPDERYIRTPRQD